MPVIAQYVNKLALHRDGAVLLCRYDHLRLCVLMLAIILGRRIDEILCAPRGLGEDGPLKRFAAKGGPPEGALWFNFAPVKGGPDDWVYISQEWEDIAVYCVHALVLYSDEVRVWAPSREANFLILVSASNGTYGPYARAGNRAKEAGETVSTARQQPKASALAYGALHYWLRGIGMGSHQKWEGVERRWRITADGTDDDEIYRLQFHQGRHTRQSAIARDNRVTLLDRQRDLNHLSQDMQFVYQHVLDEQNEDLLSKGTLIGPGAEWLAAIGSTNDQTFSPGQPADLSSRFRRLTQNNPEFVRLNRVPLGFCTLPQGPGACTEYMECLCGEMGPCPWWCANPTDELTLVALDWEAVRRRQGQRESAAAGRLVQADKRDLLARRAEEARDAVFEVAPQDLVARLRARRAELATVADGEDGEDDL